ncbi:RDD family protein [Cellulomonas septica]|uniref:RDD family protein n=2 Tax=Cellulomonas septica TaxID=285080 RepID=A0ABX1K296_9CELL|nr:RDD family protein [Cellulomonas septica]NKY39108.1 RDD family protein [Cellulomonas septica]
MGSWLEGGSPAATTARGARLGLPPDGPGALASLGRRVAALAVDWTVCLLIAATFFPVERTGFYLTRGAPTATLLIFLLENVLLVGTVGFTLGHRVLGLRVRRAAVTPSGAAPVPDTGRPPGLLSGLVRGVLLCLVIPAVVWDSDGRGLHDRLAGTAIVRR